LQIAFTEYPLLIRISTRPHPLSSSPYPFIQTRRTWRWLTVLLVAVVAWLALTPAPPSSLDTGWDKLNHALAFAAMTWTSSFGFPAKGWRRAMPLLALFAFGAAIEVIQRWVPSRSSDWHDLLADMVGIAAGALLATLAAHLVRRR
jgi:VanZ family protein